MFERSENLRQNGVVARFRKAAYFYRRRGAADFAWRSWARYVLTGWPEAR